MAAKKRTTVEAGEKRVPSEDAQKRLVDDAIEKAEKLAESQLDMAQLFMAHGKTDVARRRLEDLIKRYGQANAAKEAHEMLKRI
jgi:TolA-binding protein